jgi:selenide,water dikinase
MYKKGETTGSNKGNRAMVAKHHLQMSAKLTATEEELLYDPQTSGGLLLSVPHEQANELMGQMQKDNIPATLIGEITDEPIGITVV